MMPAPVLAFLLRHPLRDTHVQDEIERSGLLDTLEGEARRARAAMLARLVSDGVSWRELHAAAAEDRLGLLLLERTLAPRGDCTESDVAQLAGLDRALLRRFFCALGIAAAGEDERVYDHVEVDLARRLAEYLELGITEEGTLALARTVGLGFANMADAVASLLGEGLLGAQATDPELALRYAAEARAHADGVAAELAHVLSRHVADRMRSYAVAAAEQGQGALPGVQEMAVCFADLVGFTRLGQEIAPDELGRVAELLTLTAVEVIQPPVRLVKTIGDAVMFVSPDAEALVFAALDLIDALGSPDEPMPPLRAGIAMGPTMPRGGDWYGAPVNLASRITAVAKPGTVIADEAVRRTARTDGLVWKSLGAKRFRGLRGTHRVYHARRQTPNR